MMLIYHFQFWHLCVSYPRILVLPCMLFQLPDVGLPDLGHGLRVCQAPGGGTLGNLRSPARRRGLLVMGIGLLLEVLVTLVTVPVHAVCVDLFGERPPQASEHLGPPIPRAFLSLAYEFLRPAVHSSNYYVLLLLLADISLHSPTHTATSTSSFPNCATVYTSPRVVVLHEASIFCS